MLENKFYMTYAGSRKELIIPFAEKHDIGVMTNAAHRWSNNTEQFNPLWKYNCPHIVDSGGYNIQARFVDRNGDIDVSIPEMRKEKTKKAPFYPYTVEEYHNWLQNQDFEWAAVMDYACEERFDKLHSVDERVDKTIDNIIEHFNFKPNYNLLPVLQGRSIEKYIESYDRLQNHGIPLTEIGLGTICRISSSDKIIETENRIREECKEIERIHGFGVKMNAYEKGATFESADSQAWVYPASNGRCYLYNGKSLQDIEMSDNSKKRTVLSFINYYYKISQFENFPDSDIQIGLYNLDLEDTNIENTNGNSKAASIKRINEALGTETENGKMTKDNLQIWAKAICENEIQIPLKK